MDCSDITVCTRENLLEVLAKIGGRMDLVLDASLTTALNHIVGFSTLKERGVERVFRLEAASPDPSTNTRVYCTRPQVVSMKMIADHIHSHNQSQSGLCHLIFMPQHDVLCETLLEEEGVLGLVRLHEVQLDLVQIDDDVLSMQYQNFFKEFYLYGEQTGLAWVARALLRFQHLYGIFPRIHGLGPGARMLVDMLTGMVGRDDALPRTPGAVASLIVVDRTLDLVSPMCSQLVYSGLVDEIFGLNGGYVDFGSAITGSEANSKVKLTAEDDDVYAMIRDVNLSRVGPLLKKKAQELGESYDERHSAKKISQIKAFVSKLGGLQTTHKALRTHTYAAEHMMSLKNTDELTKQLESEHSLVVGSGDGAQWVEECIHRQLPLATSLKLMSIMSVAAGGTKAYESLKTAFLHAYGYQHLVTLHNLERLGLFTREDRRGAGSFAKLRKRLRLMLTDEPQAGDKDTPHVHYGYQPLSAAVIARLAERDSIAALDEANVTKHLPQPVFTHTQLSGDGSTAAKDGAGRGTGAAAAAAGSAAGAGADRLVMVLFLGGATCSELSALRILARSQRTRFLFTTTAITNGTQLVESAVEAY